MIVSIDTPIYKYVVLLFDYINVSLLFLFIASIAVYMRRLYDNFDKCYK